MSNLIPDDYPVLLGEIKQRIRTAQYEALRAVNAQLISLYWDIGRMIVERQQGDSWGKSIVEQLATDLQAEFPGTAGFSVRNIWYMRTFYLKYSQNEKLQPMVAEIGWTHNLIIHGEMQRRSGTRILSPHDPQVWLDKERSYPSH